MTEYTEDTAYTTKIIKENKCPYCDFSLQKPYPTKRECQHCDFTLYGNPRLVAYKRKEEPFDWTIQEDRCPECDSTDLYFENKERELVCLGCGLVLKSVHHFNGYIRVDYPFGYYFDLEYFD